MCKECFLKDICFDFRWLIVLGWRLSTLTQRTGCLDRETYATVGEVAYRVRRRVTIFKACGYKDHTELCIKLCGKSLSMTIFGRFLRFVENNYRHGDVCSYPRKWNWFLRCGFVWGRFTILESCRKDLSLSHCWILKWRTVFVTCYLGKEDEGNYIMMTFTLSAHHFILYGY